MYRTCMCGQTVTDDKMHAKSGAGDEMHLSNVYDGEKHMISKEH